MLTGFVVLFLSVGVLSLRQTSATWDEPTHLASGYAALTQGDYRHDPSHPPFLRLWATLPLLGRGDVTMPRADADRATPEAWLTDVYGFSRTFLYVDNDADTLLYPARSMTLLLGALLGTFVFLWARAWLGFTAATATLTIYALEPNLGAHAALVTTDLGVSCFMFGCLYFMWQLQHRFTGGAVAGMTGCFALAVVSKFSALLLVPIVGVLLMLAVRERSACSPRRAAALVALTALVSIVAIWAVYGFRYLPSTTAGWAFTFRGTEAAAGSPWLAWAISRLDDLRMVPNAFSHGLFNAFASTLRLPAYLVGQYSDNGWWYYFPLAFVLKAPTPLLVLIAVGLGACLWRIRALGAVNVAFVLVPAALYLAAAMASGINIGVRHILPVYPLLILVAGVGAHTLLAAGRRVAVPVLATASLLWVVELSTAFPHTLTFFNSLAGGPRNGFRLLSDSNLGWGQALKPLKRWMDANHVGHVNLAYFGQADPSYYGIAFTALPGTTMSGDAPATPPVLPGYVAISGTTLSGTHAPAWWRLFYAPFRTRQPVAVVGNSIFVFRVDQWPTAIDAGTRPATVRRLADALLLGLGWPAGAARYYAEYLRRSPNDSQALMRYGVALFDSGRTTDAVGALHRAVALDGRQVEARLLLAKAALAARDLPTALAQTEQALILRPEDAEVHTLLARVRLIQRDDDAALRSLRRALELNPAHPDARQLLQRLAASPLQPLLASAGLGSQP